MNVLTVHDISKRYGKQQALDHVSFTLESGHIYGFVGNNGAGKTTLFRILAGLVAPNSGSITLLGASSPKELRAARRKVGFLLPRESFSEDLTALQNLMAFQRLRGYHNENEAIACLPKPGWMRITPTNGSSRAYPPANFSGSPLPRYSWVVPSCWCWTNRKTVSIPPPSMNSASISSPCSRRA